MKKLVLSLLALCSLAGCATGVSLPDIGNSANTDEVWYAKSRYILIFRTDNDVYYCPPAQAAGQKTCKKAVMHDE
jgi:uncharacterized protein YceK